MRIDSRLRPNEEELSKSTGTLSDNIFFSIRTRFVLPRVPNQHMVAFIIAFPPAQILRSKFDRGAFWKARQCRPGATIQELGSLATCRANSAISEYWANGSFAAK